MLIKGGLHGQPGNPHDESDEGVFIARINPGGHASRRSEELQVGQRIIEVNTFFFLNDLFLYLAIDTVFHPSGIIQNGRRKLLSKLLTYLLCLLMQLVTKLFIRKQNGSELRFLSI